MVRSPRSPQRPELAYRRFGSCGRSTRPLAERRSFLIATDLLTASIAVWLSFWLRLADPFSPDFLERLWLLPATGITALTVYGLTGQYKTIIRYTTSSLFYQIATRNGLVVLLVAMTGVMLKLPLPPRSSWLLLWILLTGFTSYSRFGLRDLLLSTHEINAGKVRNVAIYGAGSAGAQLATSLRHTKNCRVAFFVDDNPLLRKREINGIPIRDPRHLMLEAREVDQVLLAIPSLSRRQRREIVASVQKTGLSILQVPSVEEITAGLARIDDLRPISIEELLGRDAVPPVQELLGPGIKGANVCVTGAGGSIGSEICRQILRLEPARLILLENSEPSLYTVYHELLQSAPRTLELHPVLGSATDAGLVARVFRDLSVDITFHAAAYKHVPLVEANPVQGLANNVFSTLTLCSLAERYAVRQLVLISTDKAVRPTNVMGASKRLAELITKAYAQQAMARGGTPCYSMVRFGNVLGSSGSVVPLFSRQIAEGGPITITHREIIRYFMTIPEAAQLVIQAAALAKGGEVFLLDMGEPVRIVDLAKEMVRLSGLTLKDQDNPEGDIEIIYTGLRPGEKLYEELLIDGQSMPTHHPLIYQAAEPSMAAADLLSQLSELQSHITNQDDEAALAMLSTLVPEWQRNRDGANQS